MLKNSSDFSYYTPAQRELFKLQYGRKIAQDTCLIASVKTPDLNRTHSLNGGQNAVPCTATTFSGFSTLKTYPYSVNSNVSACNQRSADYSTVAAAARATTARQRCLSNSSWIPTGCCYAPSSNMVGAINDHPPPPTHSGRYSEMPSTAEMMTNAMFQLTAAARHQLQRQQHQAVVAAAAAAALQRYAFNVQSSTATPALNHQSVQQLSTTLQSQQLALLHQRHQPIAVALGHHHHRPDWSTSAVVGHHQHDQQQTLGGGLLLPQ